MSDKLAQLKVQYTNNSAMIGEITTQQELAAAKIKQLVAENISLMQQFALLSEPAKEEKDGAGTSKV